MKKLIFAAALAALTTGAFAERVGQVYEMKISLKTVVCKDGKVSGDLVSALTGLSKKTPFAYRTQGSVTFIAVIWGCGCDEAFSGEWGTTGAVRPDDTEPWYGTVVFDKKTGTPLGGIYSEHDLEWVILSRMGKKADEAAVEWTLAVGDGFLVGAGFGKIKDTAYECGTIMKSAKGNVAGDLEIDDLLVYASTCNYCEDSTVGVCEPWPFCVSYEAEDGDIDIVECLDGWDEDVVPAYGTWTLKYLSGASKKLSDTTYITASYSFPKNSEILAQLVAAAE